MNLIASLNNKITFLCILNILFSLGLFALASIPLINGDISDSDDLENLDIKVFLYFLLLTTTGFARSLIFCSILCSSTECGDPIPRGERIAMAFCCTGCLQCRDMAALSRKAASKAAFTCLLL